MNRDKLLRNWNQNSKKNSVDGAKTFIILNISVIQSGWKMEEIYSGSLGSWIFGEKKQNLKTEIDTINNMIRLEDH